MTKEAYIIINGIPLTDSESMALRVAVASKLMDYSDQNFLGKDEHGRTMVKSYRTNLSNVQKFIFNE